MDGIEDKLSQLLNDPNSMAQIMSLVQSFGLGSPPESKGSEDNSPPPPPPDDQMLRSLMGIMRTAQQNNPKQEALLSALKPFLRPERRKKIDRAMQIARISHIAGCAIRGFGQKPEEVR